jgi:hypothetical protein
VIRFNTYRSDPATGRILEQSSVSFSSYAEAAEFLADTPDARFTPHPRNPYVYEGGDQTLVLVHGTDLLCNATMLREAYETALEAVRAPYLCEEETYDHA